jgi:hypothetical protein
MMEAIDLAAYRARRHQADERGDIARQLRAVPLPTLVAAWMATRRSNDIVELAAFLRELAAHTDSNGGGR